MKKLCITILALIGLIFFAIYGKAQQTNQSQINSVQVIQFHSEHRCITCKKIEKLVRTTLTNNFPTLSFSLVNVDDKKNEKMAEKFQATGTALYLYNSKTGKKKDLTDFAFMKAGDEKKFEAELKKFIEEFIKS